MKLSTRCLFELLIVCGAGAGSSRLCAADEVSTDSAEEAPLSWSATYASWYSFQGLDYSEGKPVLQPELSGSLQGFSLSAWGNLDQSLGELNEVDLGVQREWSLNRASGALGYAYLWYPNRDWEPTHEILAELTVEAPLSPSLSAHWDVAAGNGRYWTLGLSQALPWREGAVALGTRLNVQDHYYEMSGIPALETSLTITSGWAGISVEQSLSHFWGWENGDFRDDLAVPGGWVLSVVASPR